MDALLELIVSLVCRCDVDGVVPFYLILKSDIDGPICI